MPTLSLKKLLGALDLALNEINGYVDPVTCEIVTISADELELLESEEDPTDLPAWQADTLAELRKFDLDALLPLPDKFDIHEWEIMKRFASSVREQSQSDALLDAIHGSGAFRSFRREIERLRLRDAWEAFRHAALKKMAFDWAEQHGLHCVDDAG